MPKLTDEEMVFLISAAKTVAKNSRDMADWYDLDFQAFSIRRAEALERSIVKLEAQLDA